MRRPIASILAASILLMFCFFSASSCTHEKKLLSEMSDREVIKFVKDSGITIPADFADSPSLGEMIKNIISAVEKDPDTVFAYSYTVSLDFAEAIKEAVNRYYGG